MLGMRRVSSSQDFLQQSHSNRNILKKIALFRLEKKTLFCFAISLYTLIFSLVIGPLYIDGDQFYYRLLYAEVPLRSIVDAFIYYGSTINSQEFGHFLLIWAFGGILDKDVFIALSNSLLAFLLSSCLLRLGVNRFVVILIIAANFYFMVLLFAAERLKFSFIFLLASLYFSKNPKIAMTFAIFSILTHIQSLISYMSILASCVNQKIFNYVIKKYFRSMVIVAILGVVLFFILPQINAKLGYVDIRPASELVKVSIFFSLASFYSKKKINVILVFFPLFVATLILGGSRINMISYMAFMYYALQYKGGINFSILASSAYFAYQGYDFISNVLTYGTAFGF